MGSLNRLGVARCRSRATLQRYNLARASRSPSSQSVAQNVAANGCSIAVLLLTTGSHSLSERSAGFRRDRRGGQRIT
jgi:hypothetical protein